MNGLIKLKGLFKDFPNSSLLKNCPKGEALYWGKVVESPAEGDFRAGDVVIIRWGDQSCVMSGGHYYIKPEFLEKTT